MARSRITALILVIVSWAVLLYLAFPSLAYLPRERRGDYLYGYFDLLELYLTVPLAIVTLTATVVFFLPARVRRPIGHRLFAVVFSALAALVIFDLWFALVHLGARKPDYWLDNAHISRLHNESDAELGFRRSPGTEWLGASPKLGDVVRYRTDENGFRNPPDLDRADIVFLGDSYTEAAQIDEGDTFPQVVAERTGLVAANLGRGAYGPQQELIVLERYGLPLDPDVVVWQLFEGNDAFDAGQYDRWRRNPHAVSTTLLERYLNNSFFNKWLTRTKRPPYGDFASLTLADGSSLPLQMRYRHEPSMRIVGAWGSISNAMREGAQLCAARGIRLLVVTIPTFARTARPFLKIENPAVRRAFLPEGVSDRSEFAASLADLCEELDCGYLDAFPLFRAEMTKDPASIFIPGDEHLDQHGHAVLAAAIADWIDERAE